MKISHNEGIEGIGVFNSVNTTPRVKL